MILTIDGSRVGNKEEFYGLIRSQIGEKEVLGSSLDGLYDLFTGYEEPLTIRLVNSKDLEKNLGDYYLRLMKLFNDLETDLNFKVYKD